MIAGQKGGDLEFYSRVFALAAGVVTAGLAITVLLPIWRPVTWALLIAALLHPAQARLGARLGNRPALAAAALTVVTFLVIAGPVSGLAAAFGSELAGLAGNIQPGSASTNASLSRIPELQEVPVAGKSLEAMRRKLGISRARARGWLARGLELVVREIGPLSSKLALGAASTVFGFLVMLVILFCALRDGVRMVKRSGELVPWPRRMRRHLVEHLDTVLRAIVFGTLVTAAIQGALVGVAFAVLKLPGPIVFGALAGLLALVPLGGTAFVWGPAVMYLLAEERWIAATGLGVWGLLLVGTIDNLLRPMLAAGRGQVGTLTVFLGAIGGVAAFGVIGLVIGPMILELLLALLAMRPERLARR